MTPRTYVGPSTPRLFHLLAAFFFLVCQSFPAASLVGVNDAPVLNTARSPVLLPVYETQGTLLPLGAVGTPVSLLVDFSVPAGQVDNVTDADDSEGDGPALLGIAVTATNTTNGSWYYSIDGGDNWLPLGAVSSASARLLAADANTRLYFRLSGGFSGTIADAITFRAWDRTSGTNGALADTSANGGATAFSSATDVAALDVIGGILFRAATSAGAAGTSATTLVFTKPAGTVGGDVMIAGITLTPANVTITPPAGWTLVRRLDNGAGNTLAVFSKAAGASEPSAYTWTSSASVLFAGGIATFAGVSAVDPIDVETGTNTPSSLTHTALGVTTSARAGMLLTWHAFSSAASWIPPGGMTEIVDRNSETSTGATGVSLEANMLALAGAGTTGAKSATASNNADTGNTATLALGVANVAPFLHADPSPALADEIGNSGVPAGAVGTLVSDLVQYRTPIVPTGNVTDIDGPSLGIAVIGADTASGTWFYSTNGGTNWNALGAVSDGAALLLAANGQTRLYFQPQPGFIGTIANALVFRAWDGFTGTSDTTAVASVNGGATAFSAASIGASLTIVDPGPGALLSVQAISGSGAGVGGTIVSNDGFIKCGTEGFACQHEYFGSPAVTLQTMNSSGFTGWLGACTGTDPCVLDMSAPRSVTGSFVASEGYAHPFDLDDDASVGALTDGLLIVRVLQQFSGAPLTAGALGAAANRTDPANVRIFALDVKPKFDVDGNGQVDLATDGVLIVRYLLGFRGDALVENAVGDGARRDADAIVQYLQTLIP